MYQARIILLAQFLLALLGHVDAWLLRSFFSEKDQGLLYIADRRTTKPLSLQQRY